MALNAVLCSGLRKQLFHCSRREVHLFGEVGYCVARTSIVIEEQVYSLFLPRTKPLVAHSQNALSNQRNTRKYSHAKNTMTKPAISPLPGGAPITTKTAIRQKTIVAALSVNNILRR